MECIQYSFSAFESDKWWLLDGLMREVDTVVRQRESEAVEAIRSKGRRGGGDGGSSGGRGSGREERITSPVSMLLNILTLERQGRRERDERGRGRCR